jgi:hypothetical protein
MAYFFMDFKDAGKQDPRGLLSSVLYQLCDQSLPCLDILSYLHSTHHDGSEQPSDDALRQCLKDMLTIAVQVPIYLVVDALDESPNTRGIPSSRRRVLDLVKELVELKRPNLRLCVTSRDEMDIRIVLEPLTPTPLSLHNQKGQNEDIVDYVTSVVYSDPELNMRGWREEDKELVITTLSRKAGGMWGRHCLTCNTFSYCETGFAGFIVKLKFFGSVLRGICDVPSTNCPKLSMRRMSASYEKSRSKTEMTHIDCCNASLWQFTRFVSRNLQKYLPLISPLRIFRS